MRYAAAGPHDVLDVGLYCPPRRNLRDIARLEHGLRAADRVGRSVQRQSILIARRRVLADFRMRDAERERVIGAAGEQSLESNAAVDIAGESLPSK